MTSNAFATAVQAPGAPTNVSATGGVDSINVYFTPGPIGSGTLVSYNVECVDIGSLGFIVAYRTGSGSSSPVTINASNSYYRCRVLTVSTDGISPGSAESNEVLMLD